MAAGDDISLPSVFKQLHMNATRSKTDTDNFAVDFFCNAAITHKDYEINVFQRQFTQQRTQANILKIKAEKMKEQLPCYLIKYLTRCYVNISDVIKSIYLPYSLIVFCLP